MKIIRNFKNFINNKINNPIRDRNERNLDEYRKKREEEDAIENNLDLYDIDNEYHKAVDCVMKLKKEHVFLNRNNHNSLDTIISAIDNSKDEIFICLSEINEIYDRDFILNSMKDFLFKNGHSKIYIISKYIDNDKYVFNELRKLQKIDIYNDRIILFNVLKETIKNLKIDPYNEDEWNEDLNNFNFNIKHIVNKYFGSNVFENLNIYIADNFFIRIENIKRRGSSYNAIYKNEYKNLIKELKSFLKTKKPVN